MSALEGMQDLFAAAVALPDASSTAKRNKTDIMVVEIDGNVYLITGTRIVVVLIFSLMFDIVRGCFTWRTESSAPTACVVGETTQVGNTKLVVLGIGTAAKLYTDGVIQATNGAAVMKKLTKMLSRAHKHVLTLKKTIDKVKDKAAKEIAAVKDSAAKLDANNHVGITKLTKQRDGLQALLKWEIQQGEMFVSSSQQLQLLPVPQLVLDSVPLTVLDFDTVD